MGQSSDVPCPGTGGGEEWTFAVRGERVVWDWTTGSPPIRSLEPVRKIPRGQFASRGVPGQVASAKTGGWVGFESGLEYSLLRVLERDSSVAWIVSQPFTLHGHVRHTPDFIEQRLDGRVRVWDVRPTARRDERFEASAAMTKSACSEVGWDYAVHEGLPPVEELNLLWLYGHRRPPAGLERLRPQVLRAARRAGALADLYESTQAGPSFIAVMWHLVWLGELVVDVTHPLTPSSEIAVLVS